MIKMGKPLAGLIGLLLLVFFAASCSVGPFDEVAELGTLRIFLGGDVQAMSLVSPKAITGVDLAVVNLVHVDEVYASIRASATWPLAGAIAIEGIRTGGWLLQVSLVDGATGTTMYYGEKEIGIEPGDNGSVSVTVYGTGFGDVVIVEGLLPPIIEVVGEPDFANSVVNLHIDPAGGMPFRYSIGAESDPFGEDSITDPAGVDLPAVGFDEVVRTVSLDTVPDPDLESEILDFIFSRPYTYPGPEGYDQPAYVPLAITLHTSIPGASMRYSINGAPTYNFGLLAGDGTTIFLDSSATLQVVSFLPGDPESLSEVTVAEYEITYVGGDVQILVEGEPIAEGGTIDFGFADPDIDADPVTVIVENNGADPLNLIDVTPIGEFGYDWGGPAEILPGGSLSFEVYFNPVETGPDPVTGTLAVTTDDPDEDVIGLNLTGIGNDAPELTLLTGMGVYDAGSPEVNGFYEESLDPETGLDDHLGYPVWQKSGTDYYIFFENFNWSWLISEPIEGVLPQYDDYMHEYYRWDNLGKPIGWGDGWDWQDYYGANPSPFVYEVKGIYGRLDLLEDSGMVIAAAGGGHILSTVYETTDLDGDLADTPLHQWYISDSEDGSGIPIAGATDPFYRTSWDDYGFWIYVALKPKSLTGVPVGEEIFTERVLISDVWEDYFGGFSGGGS
jgi:hypothetical protein